MVILVIGATYAYFSVTSTKNAGTTTITGDIGGDTIGTVTLSGGNAELYLGVSDYDMSEANIGTVYYSSTTEGSRETSLASAGKATYTAELTGDDTYNGKDITEVVTGIEQTSYQATPSWDDRMSKMDCHHVDVVFEDIIRPISTAYWFYLISSTANINSMDLTNLDTSNVTDMSKMFMMGNLDAVTGLENLNVSNVTNMSQMFSGSTITTELDLSGWNTSKVTDMSYFFEEVTLNVDLDLSGWDTSSITNYKGFDHHLDGTGTLTQPIWPTA